MQEVNVQKTWQKYESLVSGLSYSLCEELRLVLLPTQAAQLRCVSYDVNNLEAPSLQVTMGIL